MYLKLYSNFYTVTLLYLFHTKILIQCIMLICLVSLDYVLVGMTSSNRSGLCGGESNDEADWRSNRCFLPSWYERHKCTRRHPCIIDVWEWDDTNRPGDVTSSVSIRTRVLYDPLMLY
jgi:hypothetical protein